ncbi:hypothetical protein BCAR13_940091 [Paraburkholderia caribensis]|nr:hypothetical protein BCAR13_940091 [Paraburkholderia caribensis]
MTQNPACFDARGFLFLHPDATIAQTRGQSIDPHKKPRTKAGLAHHIEDSRLLLVAALFPVMMHLHLMALVMVVVCKCRGHAHKTCGRSDQCQNNLLHFRSLKSER